MEINDIEKDFMKKAEIKLGLIFPITWKEKIRLNQLLVTSC